MQNNSPKYLLLLLLLVLVMPLQAQRYPTDYFTHPLKVPVSITGAFAEIRPNHFHSGIDLRIGGKVGEPVYAPADGYVSRINISAWGGGKALYITHPNGYRTVYMHLNDYVGDIGAYVRNYQQDHQCYAFDVELPVDSIPVRRGQLIAHAGNTGSSGGPHLHYEVRLASNDQTINPFYFGMTYSDPVAPTIRNVKLYPADDNARVEESQRPVKMYDKRKSGKSTVSVTRDTFHVQGRFYAGIYATDVSEVGSTSKNGVERIELWVDDSLFYRYAVPTFLFEETRAVNALIDYPEYQRSREYYILTRHLPGDRNTFSTPLRDDGYLLFGDRALHRLEYRVFDYKGNRTTRRFYVRDMGPAPAPAATVDTGVDLPGEPIRYAEAKHFVRPGFEARIPAGTLYANDRLVYQTYSRAGYVGKLHTLSLTRYPLPPHQAYTLRLSLPEVPAALWPHLVVVSVESKGPSACTTKLDGDRLVATVKSFGTFGVMLDTVPPKVRPLNFSDGAVAPSPLKIKVTDDLAGIQSYKCYINGQWVLAEHDGKTATLTIDPRAYLKSGSNKLRVVVTDAAHNVTDLTYTLRK